MNRYSVAHARERLAEVLDEADAGNAVVIERRGVRYVLRVETAPPRRRPARATIETIDPAVANGQWQWSVTSKGMRFTRRRRA